MAQQSRNRIAVVWVMRTGGGNKGMIDSCIHTNRTNILYSPAWPRAPTILRTSIMLAGGVPPCAVSPLVVFPPAVFGGCAPSGLLSTLSL